MRDQFLIDTIQEIVQKTERKLMAAIDDLQAAVVAQQAQDQVIITTLGNIFTQVGQLTTQVATLTAALAAAQGNTTDPAVEAAAQAITAGIASVQAEITAVTPAPVVPPSGS